MNGEHLSSDDLRERIRAEERQRLSLELHDTVGQTLVLIKLQLTRMQDSLNQPLDAARQMWLHNMLAFLIPEIDSALQMVQTATFTLYGSRLTEVGLVAILHNECDAFTRRTGIHCEASVEPLAVDAERGQSVAFIVREALCNIARHSRATTAQVMLQRSGECAVLAVRDNGIGIDLSRMETAMNVGLRGMKERARALGGELAIDSTPNEGTALTVSFPLSRADPPRSEK
ncbi:MAG TPA: sensor histidine kinase [Nitrospiraceae bacterium]|nr:sensor histidine kinase [Nitrospiraceae bacterium]